MAGYLRDYYLLLKVERDASGEEIDKRLKECQRMWRQRENAPRPEHRQEAEENMRLVPEIKKALLGDDETRARYDRQLLDQERRRAEDAGDSPDAIQAESADLQSEARRLLAEGNVHDALMTATTLTTREAGNAEAWALLGDCQAAWAKTWAEAEKALDSYRKAIDLRPNDAEFYYELGGLQERRQEYDEALREYGRAAEIDRGNVAYRAAIGNVLAETGRIEEAVPILEECVAGEPGNAGYSSLLGRCYADCAVREWQRIGDGFVITKAEHVESARRFARKIRGLVPSAPELGDVAADLEDGLAEATARRFDGSVPLTLGGILVGLFLAAGTWQGAAYMFGVTTLYALTSITLQHRLTKREVARRGHKTMRNRLRAMRDPKNRRTMLRGARRGLMDDLLLLRKMWEDDTWPDTSDDGCVPTMLSIPVAIVCLLLVPFVLPVLVVRNLFRDWDVTAEVVRELYQRGQALYQRGRTLFQQGRTLLERGRERFREGR